MSLIAHIFFAAKGATICYERYCDLFIGNRQQASDVIAIIPNTLAT